MNRIDNLRITPNYDKMPGSDLLNELDKRAPLSSQSVETLKETDWEEFFSLRVFENNGTPNADHIRLALKKIDQQIPEATKDWTLCRAKYDSTTAMPLEHDRVQALLRKKTEERIRWEKQPVSKPLK